MTFPLNESFRSLVNLLSRYGTCIFLFPSPIKLKDLMQLPKVSNDLLIFFPSTNLYPLLLVLAALSDPAKSIKQNLPMLTSSDAP